MNDINTNKLYKRFKFLSKKNLPNGFECGDGWYKLIYDMCKELKAANPPSHFIITRVMERYGDLEVHTKYGNMQTRVILDEYNTRSLEICDACGNNRDLELCDKCKTPEVDYSEQKEDSVEENDECSSGNCGTP